MMKSEVRDMFLLPVNFVAFPSGATKRELVQIDADSDFILQKIGGRARYLRSKRATIPDVMLSITDTSTYRMVTFDQIALTALMRTQLPERRFPARACIGLIVTNDSPWDYEAVQIALIGQKAFQLAAQRRP